MDVLKVCDFRVLGRAVPPPLSALLDGMVADGSDSCGIGILTARSKWMCWTGQQ